VKEDDYMRMSDIIKGIVGFITIGTVISIARISYVLGENAAIHKIYENGMAVMDIAELETLEKEEP
jgi:hypothetical protein